MVLHNRSSQILVADIVKTIPIQRAIIYQSKFLLPNRTITSSFSSTGLRTFKKESVISSPIKDISCRSFYTHHTHQNHCFAGRIQPTKFSQLSLSQVLVVNNQVKRSIMCGSTNNPASTRTSCCDTPANPAVTEHRSCSTKSKAKTKPKSKGKEIQDIEDLHTQAVNAKSRTYIDPATGFTVFTEYAHLKRGKCCGNICRHCPYGWENVSYTKNGKLVRREARVQSGDKENVQLLLDRIENGDGLSIESISTSPSLSPSSSSSSSTTPTTNSDVDQIEDSQDHGQSDLDDSDSDSDSDFIKNKIEVRKLKKRGKGGRSGGTYTSKNVPYTRTGDKGTSMLLSGERRSKDDDCFEAMGTVDELCSIVGVAHAELEATLEANERDIDNTIDYGQLTMWLVETMSRLFDIGSHVAKPKKKYEDEDEDDGEHNFTADGIGGGFDKEHILVLEEWIDVMTEKLPELGSFVLPTGGKASAQLHVARCVCRRAERRTLPLVREGVCDPNVLQYLNRLSDFLFTAARWANFCEGKEEVQYRRYFRGAKQRGVVKVNLREEKKETET